MGLTRRIVMFNRVAADGCFAGSDGNLDWVVPEEELDKSAAEGLSGTDAMLFGRRTYEMFEGFWPGVAADNSPTAPDPHGAGRHSPEMRALADWINKTTKVVFSRTRKEVSWKNSHLLREFDPREIIAMKSQPGQDIMIFGSGSIVSQLTQHGLIDEYQLVVSPLFLSSGRPLIDGLPKSTPLELLEVRQFSSGNVRLRYAPKR